MGLPIPRMCGYRKNPMPRMCGYRASAYTLQRDMTEGEGLGWEV